MDYVLVAFGFTLAQSVSLIGRYARITSSSSTTLDTLLPLGNLKINFHCARLIATLLTALTSKSTKAHL